VRQRTQVQALPWLEAALKDYGRKDPSKQVKIAATQEIANTERKMDGVPE
jgi:hypothetical protein